jgi:lysophospholipase L1-like esterase
VSSTPRRPISAGKQVAFTVVAVLLVLLAIEVSVRAYHFVRNVGAGGDEEPRGYVVDDAETGYSLKPGYVGGGIRVNSLGFRGDEVRSAAAPGTFRIATLGDSATFGPHEEECSYPYVLADLLAPRPVEVVNAAVEGYRSDRALVHLRRDVLPLRPRLVTVFLGWNDLYQTDPNVEADQLSLRGSPLAQVLSLSDAAQTFRRAYFLRFQTRRAETQNEPAPALEAYRPEAYAERLRQVFQTARAGGADVVTLTWPTILGEGMPTEVLSRVHYPPYTNRLADLKLLYARYQETLRQVAADERVPVVDAASAFDRLPDKGTLFKDTAHFSCEGQMLVARTLADALATRIPAN